MDHLVERLLQSTEPSIRWKLRTQVLGESEDLPDVRALREEVRASDRVQRLLAPFRSVRPDPYAKWQGAHWVLAALADLGYPLGDRALHPVREQVLAAWLDPGYRAEFPATSKASAYRRGGVPVIDGRHRAHASQPANALWSLQRLGIADARTDELIAMLLRWQWPDGGWNCDRNPAARMSSLMETTLPMVALHECGARAPARRAAEVLLERRVVFHRGSDQLLRADFATLHYPLYWHYDLLGGLKALARLDLLAEPRCAPALDLLESLQVTDGWPAHRRHYRRVSTDVALHNDSVDWGPTSAVRANPWVTVDALSVLRRAGRR